MIRISHLIVISTLAATPAFAQTGFGADTSTRGDTGRGGGEASAGGDDGSHFEVRAPRSTGQRFRVVSGRPDTSTHGTTSSGQWSEWADEYCGGDSLIWFDMDENGDPVLGTVEVECL